jgi:predicted DNA-binding transcriptional regulator AlpA
MIEVSGNNTTFKAKGVIDQFAFNAGGVTIPRYTVTKQELAACFSVSCDTIDNWVKNGVLPQPIRLPRMSGNTSRRGKRIVRYKLAESIKWYDQYQARD